MNSDENQEREKWFKEKLETLRKEAGIRDIPNGEHRVLQLQIDFLHSDVRYIKEHVECGVKADIKSNLNFKLLCLLFVAVIGVYGAFAAMVLGILSI